MAAWDIVGATLDFHDRNCVDCKQRVPVRLPNLSTQLGEREKVINEYKPKLKKISALSLLATKISAVVRELFHGTQYYINGKNYRVQKLTKEKLKLTEIIRRL